MRSGLEHKRGLAIPLVGAGLSLLALLAACTGPDSSNKIQYDTRPPEEIYREGSAQMEAGDHEAAVNTFDKLERSYPFSVWSTRAALLAAYAAYLQADYDTATLATERFLELNPGHKDAPYAQYLRASSYFEMILDVERDQTQAYKAAQVLEDLIRRYPDSDYAKDARAKLSLVQDHLAAKDMSIGRYYLEQEQWLAAIGRFKRVVQSFAATKQAPEALHRLTEAYLSMGAKTEAQEIASVMLHNFKGNEWTTDSLSLLADEGLAPVKPAIGDIQLVRYTDGASGGVKASKLAIPPKVDNAYEASWAAAMEGLGSPAQVALKVSRPEPVSEPTFDVEPKAQPQAQSNKSQPKSLPQPAELNRAKPKVADVKKVKARPTPAQKTPVRDDFLKGIPAILAMKYHRLPRQYQQHLRQLPKVMVARLLAMPVPFQTAIKQLNAAQHNRLAQLPLSVQNQIKAMPAPVAARVLAMPGTLVAQLMPTGKEHYPDGTILIAGQKHKVDLEKRMNLALQQAVAREVKKYIQADARQRRLAFEGQAQSDRPSHPMLPIERRRPEPVRRAGVEKSLTLSQREISTAPVLFKTQRDSSAKAS